MKREILSAAIITAFNFNIGGLSATLPAQQAPGTAFVTSLASFQQPAAQAPQVTNPPSRPDAPKPANPQQVPPVAGASTATAPQAPSSHMLTTIVLDPGHGGSDTGARGANGVAEKDIVLIYARAAKIELEKLGFHVVMTRQADEDPSFDDRATIANAQRNAIFLTFHVSSTGPIGTVRTYFYDSGPLVQEAQSGLFAPDPSGSSPSTATGTAALKAASAADTQANAASNPLFDLPATHPPHGFVLWNQAQEPYVNESHQLADLIQGEIAKAFTDSQQLAIPVPERDLRSVAAPAVAVEVSSVDVTDPLQLTSIAGTLGQAIARAVAAFRPIYEQSAGAGAKN